MYTILIYFFILMKKKNKTNQKLNGLLWVGYRELNENLKKKTRENFALKLIEVEKT